MGTAGTERLCAAVVGMLAGLVAGPRVAAVASVARQQKLCEPLGKALVLLAHEVKKLGKELGPVRETAGGAGEPSVKQRHAAVGQYGGWW